jgi:hypothetical protein
MIKVVFLTWLVLLPTLTYAQPTKKHVVGKHSQSHTESVKRNTVKKHKGKHHYPITQHSVISAATISAKTTNVHLAKVLSKYKVPEHKRSTVIDAINTASKKCKIGNLFITTLIAQESSFRSKAVSSAGAVGLMQIMPAHKVKNPYNISNNVSAGTCLLAAYIEEYGIVGGLAHYGNSTEYIGTILNKFKAVQKIS